MKPGIILSALSILTIALPLSAVSISQSVRAELHAQADDITALSTGGTSFFVSNDWEVSISRDGNGYIYSGKKTGKQGITVVGGRLTKSGGKHFYKWNNAGTVYQVTWRPTDPNFARVQAFDRSGREVFNNLMSIYFN